MNNITTETAIKTMLDRLVKNFNVSDIIERKPGLTTLAVDKDSAETMIRELRDREAYSHLNFMTCTDYIENNIFTLTYMLHNYDSKHSLAIHVDINRDQAEMTSIHRLWAQAWTYQRELREMYGINFPGSPRLEEDFCLEGWDQMPPMRRDFNTAKYSDEQFGHREGRVSEDPRQHMKTNLYPNRGGDE